MFVIQFKEYPDWDNKWSTRQERYKTLEEAKAAFETLPYKTGHRIAEEYTVIRYNVIK